MTEGLAAGVPQVLDLLNYIEQVEKLKTKPAFSVPTEFFVAYQHDLKGLPELQFNLQVEGDDVWLRLPRLQEIAAPEPDEILKPWVTLPKSPEKTPELKGEIIILEGKREVARERIEDNPEVRELFDWYVEYQWEPWATAERPRRKTIARYHQLFSLQQAISSEGLRPRLNWLGGLAMRPGRRKASPRRSSTRCWSSPAKSRSTKRRSTSKFDRAMSSLGWKPTATPRWSLPACVSWRRSGAAHWPPAQTGSTRSRHRPLTAR